MKSLRPHQEAAINMLRQSLARGNTRPMVQAPTGMGKTVIAAHIVAGALAKGNRVIFCVPAISLIDQTVDSFVEQGITDVGVIQSYHELTDRTKPVQVASVQTLMRRKIPHADVVMIDEAHRWFSFYGDWMSSWSAIPFVGLSATPWTKGLGKHYDDLIVAATTQELIDAGYLSDFRVFAPSHPDLTGVRTVAGDYHEGDLGAAMNKAPLVSGIVQTWLQRGENRSTLVFGVNRAHAKSIQMDFEAAGVPCGYVDAYTDRDERQVIANQFHNGSLKVVANVGCLTTGVDWDVRCIVLARPTKSEMLFTQIIGRGLRTAPGKDDCLILDHSDTHLRLGFVTDIHHEKLDGGKYSERESKPKESLPKECPKCTYLKPPKMHVCPACGFAPERQSNVDEVDGELLELHRRKAKKNRTTTSEEKSDFFGGLIMYGQRKGYKSGWASHQYKECFGVWPNAYKNTQPCEPNESVINWIKHQQIKYAKRRAA